MKYDIKEPITTVFLKVEYLEQLAIAINNPFTSEQLIDIGLKILKNCGEFVDGLKQWYKKPSPTQTVPEFKTHFTTERFDLKMSLWENLATSKFTECKHGCQQRLRSSR